MNCRPGDLAFIIQSDFKQNIGQLVAVLKPANLDHYFHAPHGDGGFNWECEALGAQMVGWDDAFTVTPVVPGSVVALPDAHLKPIRDPGDDAVDEMIQLTGEATARTA